jgi:hypothetical protein
MLVNFPLDCLSEACIAASLNSFGNLLHWHESSNKARQIVLVNLHSSARIPHSVVVVAEDELYARCWSVTCYLLSEAQTPLPIDTDPLPTDGRTPHHLPPAPLHWLGDGSSHQPRCNRGHDQEGSGLCVHTQAVPLAHDGPIQRSNVVVLAMARASVDHAAPSNVPMVHLNVEVFAELCQLSAYDSVAFGSFFSSLRNVTLGLARIDEHHLISLAGILDNQQGSQVHERNAAILEELLPEAEPGTPLGAAVEQVDTMADDHDDEDHDVLPARPKGFPKRRHKVVVSHDVSLLHCNARLETKNKGFNPNSASASNTTSSAPSAKGKKSKGKSAVTSMMEATAYEGHSVSGAPPAPHLSAANVQAIGMDFCKMPAASVSGEALQKSDDVRNNTQN